MFRYVIAGAAALLLIGSAGLFWLSREDSRSPIPAVPEAAAANLATPAQPDGEEEPAGPPAADERTREQKRFDRADKDKDGRITLAERLEPRRKPFVKLDTNGDGRLSFEEWTVRTRDIFAEADKDHDGALTRPEFATTKPKRTAKARCACGGSEKTTERDE